MHTYVGEFDNATGRHEVWIETSGRAGRRPLRRAAIADEASFEWGSARPGATGLAEAILQTELGPDVPESVAARFRDDIVAALPRRGFRLGASEVMDWARANRALIDADIFGVQPPPPALSVVSEGPVEFGDGDVQIDPTATGPTASALVSACEAAWDDIRHRHPELPAVVVVLGSGVERGRLVKLGHWWSGRWVADGQVRGEVLLAGEALHLPSAQVFEVLLHEAAHGVNAARGVRDTSRGGRYHNQRFADTAREVGLKVTAMPPYGLARTELTAETEGVYESTIGRLGDAMRIARQLEGVRVAGREGTELGDGDGIHGAGADREGRARGSIGASCGCGRRLRMAPSVLARGPVVCGSCGTEFTTGAEIAQDSVSAEAAQQVVDYSFMSRRRAALDGPSAMHATPTADKRTGFAELADAHADARVVHWYERFGSSQETPMESTDHRDSAALVRAARAALAADGTLSGPALDVGGLELRHGDRVVVVGPTPDGPPIGTAGTVHSVDVDATRCRVDFATWGDTEVDAGSQLARSLRYDYLAVDSAVPQPRATDISSEVERADILEPELPF